MEEMVTIPRLECEQLKRENAELYQDRRASDYRSTVGSDYIIDERQQKQSNQFSCALS